MADQRMKPCPSGHQSGRIIGGSGTAAGPLFWAGCDHCRWRAIGDTAEEALTLWNDRAEGTENGNN